MNSDWSSLQSFSFSCDAPTNFVISDQSGSVTFSWDDMSADQYQIIYNAGNGWITEYVSNTSLEISNVPAFYTVYAYLRSVCNSSAGFISGWIFDSHTTSSGGRFAQESQLAFNVYPNPTNDVVNIKIRSEVKESFSLKIVDSFGKLIFEAEDQIYNGEVNYKVDLSSYANGVYLLQIVNGGYLRNERIIVH